MTIFASRIVVEVPGNDDPSVAPVGYVYYKFDTGAVGTYTQRFDTLGNIDPAGPIFITITIEEDPNDYTKVSWESNIPIYSVIVKGGPNYNQYFYSAGTTSDTELTAPINPNTGLPYDISHVSFIFLPTTPPTPTVAPTPTPTVITSPTISPTPTTICPTTTCPPKPPFSIISCLFIIGLILCGILALIIAGIFICLYFKKHKHCCKDKTPPRV